MSADASTITRERWFNCLSAREIRAFGTRSHNQVDMRHGRIQTNSPLYTQATTRQSVSSASIIFCKVLIYYVFRPFCISTHFSTGRQLNLITSGRPPWQYLIFITAQIILTSVCWTTDIGSKKGTEMKQIVIRSAKFWWVESSASPGPNRPAHFLRLLRSLFRPPIQLNTSTSSTRNSLALFITTNHSPKIPEKNTKHNSRARIFLDW